MYDQSRHDNVHEGAKSLRKIVEYRCVSLWTRADVILSLDSDRCLRAGRSAYSRELHAQAPRGKRRSKMARLYCRRVERLPNRRDGRRSIGLRNARFGN